jgi:hypothetical protein
MFQLNKMILSCIMIKPTIITMHDHNPYVSLIPKPSRVIASLCNIKQPGETRYRENKSR